MSGYTAIVLCGGRGGRLGSLGEKTPKCLLRVRGQPILWYIILRLHLDGFNHFILPLGYRGHMIRDYVNEVLSPLNASFDMPDTGEDTPIGGRLSQVMHLVVNPFLLTNGDTLFNLDAANIMRDHTNSEASITFLTCDIVSQYGLLLLGTEDEIIDFKRDAVLRSVELTKSPPSVARGLVYSGISILNPEATDQISLADTQNLEVELYTKLIVSGHTRYSAIQNDWVAIDTQKDLDIANNHRSKDPRAETCSLLNKQLSNCYPDIADNSKAYVSR